jgi:hypothetical protein
MSGGCIRCCRYGSQEQRKTMAEWLAKVFDLGLEQYKKEKDEHDRKEAGIDGNSKQEEEVD